MEERWKRGGGVMKEREGGADEKGSWKMGRRGKQIVIVSRMSVYTIVVEEWEERGGEVEKSG